MGTPDPMDVEPEMEVVDVQLPPKVLGKVEDLGEQLKHRIPEELRDSEFLQAVKKFLRAIINEKTTDFLVDALKGFAPFGLGWLAGKVLDALLPQKLLAVLFTLIDKIAA